MNALNMVAEATGGGLWAGGYGVVIAVSITHSDGSPVKGLKTNNFKVHFIPTGVWPAAPQFQNEISVQTCAEGPPGFYALFAIYTKNALAPLPAPDKKFIYSIETDMKSKAGVEHGQTLTTLYHVEVV